MIGAIIAFIGVNFITCLVVRMVQAGCFTYNWDTYPNYSGKMIFIAGAFGQPEETYEKIHKPYCCSAYLNYSLLGYNPKNAGKQLSKLIKTKDYVVGSSVGCKAIIYANRSAVRRVFINPMTHFIALKPKYQTLIQYLAPLAEVLSYALGWLAVLPIIKTQTGRYSIALLIDQIYWMYYGDPDSDEMGRLSETGVIISKNDKYLENDIIKGIYKGARIEQVSFDYSHMMDEVASEEYDFEINNLLAD